jgi:polar amino acid transport system substrate-binding protein
MIEDRSVMNFLLLDPAYAGRVVSAGCNQAVPLYVAFSPKRPGADSLPERFDQGLLALRESGRLAQILGKYGVADWQP